MMTEPQPHEAQAPELAVIVPCHNVAATLGEALRALTGEPWDGTWEVIVVDNASTDATPDIARRFDPAMVRVVTARTGRGVAYARNAGVRETSARSVAFCDGDDVVQPGWLAAIGTALREHELVSGVVDTAALNPPWLATSRPSDGNRRLPTFGTVPFARGNNCGVRRALWERAGGFHERFRGLEDIEFSLRLRAMGVAPALVPDAVVAYRFRHDVADVWRQGYFYGLGRPALRRLACELGVPAPPRFESVRSWAWLAINVHHLADRGGRYAWTWVLANRFGVLRGWVGEVTSRWMRRRSYSQSSR